MLKNLMNREDWSEKNVAQKGFTLIELLVVIAILGILAVVGVLAFGGFTQDAKDARNTTELAQVKTAASAFTAKHAADPTPSVPTATADIAAYLDGGVGSLKCAYTWAAGVPTQGTCAS